MRIQAALPKRVVITGAEGGLGQELARVFWNAGDIVTCLSRKQCDITNREEVLRVMRELKPEVILNAAANNQVDAIEDPAVFPLAFAVNAEGPRNLAEAARELGAKFVHYSTDYVFSGEKREAYVETDVPAPVSKYGETKLGGEKFVADVFRDADISRGDWYVFRVTKLFGRPAVSAGAKMSFLALMRKLVREKPEMKIVDEEGGMPTSTWDIAVETRRIVSEGLPSGIYHLVNDGPAVTWYQFAEEIFSLETEPVVIPRHPVTADAFGVRAAKRPAWVDLRSTKVPMLRPRIDAVRHTMMQPKISLVMVTAVNARESVAQNLRGIFGAPCKYSFEVIVVDNGSQDGTPEMLAVEFPQVQLIKNSYNSGFAHACNQGLFVSQGDVVIFVNPDMLVTPVVIEHTYETLKARSEIGVMGVKLMNEQGGIVESVRRNPGFMDQMAILLKLPHLFPRVIDRYLHKDFDYSKSQEVDQVRGSFFAMRRDVLNAIGHWDEKNFFIWFEEVDLCRRARQAGYIVWYSAEASCIDYVGRAFAQRSMLQKQIWFSRSMARYFKKWHPRWQSVVISCVRPFVIVAAAIGELMKVKPKKKAT